MCVAPPSLLPDRDIVGFAAIFFAKKRAESPILCEFSVFRISCSDRPMLSCCFNARADLMWSRKVDDLFNISTELIVATVALVLLGGEFNSTGEYDASALG